MGQLGPLDYQGLIAQLKISREEAKLRQIDLADKSLVTVRTIIRMEKGEDTVRFYHLQGICRALGFELKIEPQYTLTPIDPYSSTKPPEQNGEKPNFQIFDESTKLK